MPHSTDASAPAATSTAVDEKPVVSDESAHVVLDNKSTPEALPYWLVNVPRCEWPAECPDFLRNQPQKNIQILSTPDELYERPKWDTVKEIVSESALCFATDQYMLIDANTDRLLLLQKPTRLTVSNASLATCGNTSNIRLRSRRNTDRLCGSWSRRDCNGAMETQTT